MKKGIIDRFEGGFGIIETDDGFERIDRKLLPSAAKEGDYLIIEGSKITIDTEGSVRRKKEMKQLMDKLFK